MPVWCRNPRRAIADMTAVPCGKSTSSCSMIVAVGHRDVAEAHHVGQQHRQGGCDPVEQRPAFLERRPALVEQIPEGGVLRLELAGDRGHARCAHVAIESAVCTWELSTGGDWSINCPIGSTVLPASIANEVDPSTMRDSSGPSPPTALSASSTTVRRLSCGIACSALLVASSRLPMSGGTCDLADGDDIAVTQCRASLRCRSRGQFDELLADGGAAVHRGRHVGRDLGRPS